MSLFQRLCNLGKKTVVPVKPATIEELADELSTLKLTTKSQLQACHKTIMLKAGQVAEQMDTITELDRKLSKQKRGTADFALYEGNLVTAHGQLAQYEAEYKSLVDSKQTVFRAAMNHLKELQSNLKELQMQEATTEALTIMSDIVDSDKPDRVIAQMDTLMAQLRARKRILTNT